MSPFLLHWPRSASFLAARIFTLSFGALALAGVSGCASVNFEQTLAQTNRDAADLTKGNLLLAQSASQRETLASRSAALLAQPLSQNDALQLALANSPALQTLLAQSWAERLVASLSA